MNKRTDRVKCDSVIYRDFSLEKVERQDIDEEKRLVPIAFSSEEPIEDFFGNTILDHNKESVRLDRANTGLMPVLFNHNRDMHLGKMIDVTLEKDGKGRGFAKFAKNPIAEEKFQDVLNGDLIGISVGFRLHELVLESHSDAGDVMRAIDWEPLEASFVTMPRDISVGVGRSEQQTIIRKEVPECQKTKKINQRSNTLIILK